tara:strand:- start:973 stop:1233 length:261 start_codon:yes stop_codon:yes gene_type:complete
MLLLLHRRSHLDYDRVAAYLVAYPDTTAVALLDGMKSLPLVVFRASCFNIKEKAYASSPQREGLSLATARACEKSQHHFLAKWAGN